MITTVPKLLPMLDKFLKAVTKELHTLFLHPGPDSPFQLFIWVLQISTKVFFIFGIKVQVAWCHIWTVW